VVVSRPKQNTRVHVRVRARVLQCVPLVRTRVRVRVLQYQARVRGLLSHLAVLQYQWLVLFVVHSCVFFGSSLIRTRVHVRVRTTGTHTCTSTHARYAHSVLEYVHAYTCARTRVRVHAWRKPPSRASSRGTGRPSRTCNRSPTAAASSRRWPSNRQ
jgi:hypothetical protein